MGRETREEIVKSRDHHSMRATMLGQVLHDMATGIEPYAQEIVNDGEFVRDLRLFRVHGGLAGVVLIISTWGNQKSTDVIALDDLNAGEFFRAERHEMASAVYKLQDKRTRLWTENARMGLE